MILDATGNTFQLIENNVEKAQRSDWVHQHSFSEDGVIWIERIHEYYFMDYYNRDGSTAKICGNGARASLYYLYQKKELRKECWIYLSTKAGLLRGKIEKDESITVSMPKPRYVNSCLSESGNFEIIELGNQHIVMDVMNPDSVREINLVQTTIQIRDQFPKLRYSNVNVFASVKNEIWNRTFENGVEKETLSCGSGCTAVCFSLHRKEPNLYSTWFLHTAGGSLAVEYQAPDYYLKGKVVIR